MLSSEKSRGEAVKNLFENHVLRSGLKASLLDPGGARRHVSEDSQSSMQARASKLIWKNIATNCACCTDKPEDQS